MDTEVLLSAKNIDLDKITICQFNEDGQNIIDSYVEITRHLQELGQLFQVFRFNLENLLNCYTIYPDDHLERAEHFRSTHSDFIAINALTTNLISSGRAVVDAIDACMENSYGKTSTEYKSFRTNCQSKVYDNNFAYRFFYHLRNFSQHMHLPVSISNGLFNFDLWQILNTPHFSRKKEWEQELADLNDKVFKQHDSVLHVSFCITLAQYTAGVAYVYHEFWKSIKDKLFDLKTQLTQMVEANPEMLEHENTDFNGYITYIIGEDDLHMFQPDDNVEEMYNNHLQEAIAFYESEQGEYDSLMETVRTELL